MSVWASLCSGGIRRPWVPGCGSPGSPPQLALLDVPHSEFQSTTERPQVPALGWAVLVSLELSPVLSSLAVAGLFSC